jgi:hypothetical protein
LLKNKPFDAIAKSPKNVAKTTSTLQNQVGKKLLTLASFLAYFQQLSVYYVFGVFRPHPDNPEKKPDKSG